ncbi:hypothetical protein [Kingella negevensis]|uniref:hypothetical protein n=1 Tax=Kingella negevensis TaxID=1522312 RepID=UPI00050A288F|nr:hypothetical protein [Kingella negevensis]
MGYRVGYQCFQDAETAHDYLLSQQLPTITADGKVIRPVKQGKDWYLQGQKVQLSFPPCDIAEQIAIGGMLSGVLILLAVIVFGIKQIISIINSMTQVGSEND